MPPTLLSPPPVDRRASELLAGLRAARSEADAAEVRILVGATAYADLHPSFQGDAARAVDPGPDLDAAEAAFVCRELPEMTIDAPAEFGLALGLSHDSAARLMSDALQLRHRLPRVWGQLLDGRVQAWRARRIAQATAGHPDDVVAEIDAHLARIAQRVGLVTLDRLLDEAMLRLHPEDREARQQEQLDRRHATLHTEVSDNGTARMEIAADLKDLLDFDDTLAAVAAALLEQGCAESFDVRRAMAVGVIADPDAAAELLRGQPASEERPRPTAPTRAGKQLVLYVHLSEAALRGGDVVGRVETPGHGTGQPVLEMLLRDWCGRRDTQVTIKPVIDVADHQRTDAYEIPDRLREQVVLRDGHCAFPWCTRSARSCDLDHIVPYGLGGATCSCNLAPLCRRHHRLKTHERWSYTALEPGTWLWTTPLGFTYVVDPDGTRDVTPADRPVGNGCHDPDGSG